MSKNFDNWTNVKRGAYQTWQCIASDILDCDPDFRETASNIAEIVLDANHLESFGNVPDDEMKAFKQLSYKQQLKIVKSAV